MSASITNERNITQQQLVSLKDAAMLLGLSEWTLRAWVRDGRIRSFKVGAVAVRVSVTDIEALVTERKAGTWPAVSED